MLEFNETNMIIIAIFISLFSSLRLIRTYKVKKKKQERNNYNDVMHVIIQTACRH
jgi:hypothetical protein